MSKILAIFALLMSAHFGPAAAQTPVSAFTDSVVYIEIQDQDGKIKEHGSGFLIGMDGYVITAQHLLSKFDEALDTIRVALKSRQGQAFKARMLDCTKPLFDVCLLYISSEAISVAGVKSRVQLNCGIPPMGQGITAAGYPVGDDNSLIIVPGVVSGRGLGSLAKIVMSNSVIPGMSGGPIFNQNSEVVGLVWGKDDRLGLPLFTPMSHGKNLLGVANIDCPAPVAADIAATLREAMSEVTSKIQVSSTQTAAIEAAIKNAQGTIEQVIKSADTELSSPKPQTTTFLQISNESQRKDAKLIIDKLRAAGQKVATGIELVSSAPNKGQIRYFSDKDAETAQKIKETLPSELQFSTIKVSLPNRTVGGVVEIWFPKS